MFRRITNTEIIEAEAIYIYNIFCIITLQLPLFSCCEMNIAGISHHDFVSPLIFNFNFQHNDTAAATHHTHTHVH